MKIIIKDNYDRESVADVLIAENVSRYYGENIVFLLNKNEPENSSDYYELVDDDYVLWRGMEELV